MADIGVLAQIPGLAGYLQQKAMNEGQTSQNLQQATGAMGILSQIAAQQKAQQIAQRQLQYRSAIDALGPNPTQESLAAVSARFVDDPSKLMGVQQQSLDRAATRDAAETTAKATRDATAANQQANRDAAMDRQKERIEAGIELARQRGVDQETLRRMTIAGQETMVRLAASLRATPVEQPPVAVIGPDGKPVYVNRADSIGKSPWNASINKIEEGKKKTVRDLNQAITELTRATADGGMIDKSTGSGAGALVDMGAGFFGAATPGSIAVGQMKPIFDLALKMVPRFEGPQSDKDTKSYQEAAGELANPNTPNARKKAAGKEVLRLMKSRREQFITKDMEGTEADTGGGGGVENTTREFSTEAEAIASGIKGKVKIGGRNATIK